MVLVIWQNSQENTCARVSFLIKLQEPLATLLKKRLWHRCFPVNFAKFLRKPFSQSTSGWLFPDGPFPKIMNALSLIFAKVLNKALVQGTLRLRCSWLSIYFCLHVLYKETCNDFNKNSSFKDSWQSFNSSMTEAVII